MNRVVEKDGSHLGNVENRVGRTCWQISLFTMKVRLLVEVFCQESGVKHVWCLGRGRLRRLTDVYVSNEALWEAKLSGHHGLPGSGFWVERSLVAGTQRLNRRLGLGAYLSFTCVTSDRFDDMKLVVFRSFIAAFWVFERISTASTNFNRTIVSCVC